MNKAGTQKIETQKLILRRFKIEDAEDMYNNWASDPEVTRYLTWPVLLRAKEMMERDDY